MTIPFVHGVQSWRELTVRRLRFVCSDPFAGVVAHESVGVFDLVGGSIIEGLEECLEFGMGDHLVWLLVRCPDLDE